jgi:Tol biopolymer transport system component/DNA-binding winged helix-turn-helix (wHTH) protein
LKQTNPDQIGVNLANSPDFRIGSASFSPPHCEVRTGTGFFRLQPRVMQVLVLLNSMAGKVVTKEDLILHCWDGAAVTDDSITRVISQLRKLAKELGDNVFAIRTVPKVGYALDKAEVEAPVSSSQDTPTGGPKSEARAHKSRTIILAVPVVIAALLFAWWQFGSSKDWETGPMQVLEIGPDLQSHPAVSPDGQYLVYSSDRAGQNRDLWMVRIDGGDPTRLTTHPDIDHHPAYSPSGAKLAYVRSKHEDTQTPCRVIVRDLSDGSERIVARCKNASFSNSTPAWSLDEKSLYISEEVTADQDSVVRLVELDLATGETTPLTNPGEGVRGDLDPVLSPDGSSLLFRRATTFREGKHFVLDLSDLSISQLTKEGRFATFQWTPDGQRIISFSRDDRTGLSFYSPDGELREQRPSGVVHTLLRMSRGGDLFVAEALMQRAEIVDRRGSEESRLATVAGQHRLPTISRQGQIAFFTSNGGDAVLWLVEGNEAPRRLIELPTISALAWSPDGQELAYSTEDGDHLGVFTLTSEDVRKMPWDGSPIGSIAWSPDGQSLIFGARKDDEWRLWKVDQDLAAPSQPWSEAGWWAVRSNSSAVFAARSDQPGIWQMSPSGEPAQQIEDSFASGQRIGRTTDRRNGFSVTDTQVFFHRDGEALGDNGMIMSKQIAPGGAAVAQVELAENFASFSAGENGRIVFTRDTRDFRLVSWRLIER